MIQQALAVWQEFNKKPHAVIGLRFSSLHGTVIYKLHMEVSGIGKPTGLIIHRFPAGDLRVRLPPLPHLLFIPRYASVLPLEIDNGGGVISS